MNDRSRMLLEDLAQEINNGVKSESIPVIAADLPLSERASGVQKHFEDQVNLIFDHGLERVKAVRHACDTADEALKQKRVKVLESIHNLVYCMQEVDAKAEDMQKSLGDMLVATDQV